MGFVHYWNYPLGGALSQLEGLGNLVDVKTFAAGTGSHVVTVRRLCSEGRLPALKIGSRWLIATDLLAQRLRADMLEGDTTGEGLPVWEVSDAPLVDLEEDE